MLAKRERWMGDLLCVCGTKGQALWTQNENPDRAGGKVSPIVIAIIGRFTLQPKGGDHPPVYRCGQCGRRLPAINTQLGTMPGGGTIPDEVLKRILEGQSPIQAWRDFCGFSHIELARRTGLTSAEIKRAINNGNCGSRATRAKIGAALDAPLWALENDDA